MYIDIDDGYERGKHVVFNRKGKKKEGLARWEIYAVDTSTADGF